MLQGERPMAKDNKNLGRFHTGWYTARTTRRTADRSIFDIDANGILHVTARDKGTGKQQNIRIEAGSGLNKEEIERMKNEAKANEESDKKVRERVEKLNKADGLIFNTEKQLKDYGDKIPADKRSRIDAAIAKLKEVHKAEDLDGIDKAEEELNAAWMAASEEMYKAGQQGPAAGADGHANACQVQNSTRQQATMEV